MSETAHSGTAQGDATQGGTVPSEAALYVYAIVPSADFSPTVTGIDGLPLDVVQAASGVSAVVHLHRTGPFEGTDDEVRARLIQHRDVVEECWRGAASVLPVSFNVIVAPSADGSRSAEDQLIAWLDDAAADVADELQRLSATSELRVGIDIDPIAYGQGLDEIQDLEVQLQSQSPGVRRLMSRRLESRRKELAAAAADQLYTDFRLRIAACCLDVDESATADRGAVGVPVLSMSCLVQSDQISLLGQELAEIRDEVPWANIRFLGPWPPYSFVTNSTLSNSTPSD